MSKICDPRQLWLVWTGVYDALETHTCSIWKACFQLVDCRGERSTLMSSYDSKVRGCCFPNALKRQLWTQHFWSGHGFTRPWSRTNTHIYAYICIRTPAYLAACDVHHVISSQVVICRACILLKSFILIFRSLVRLFWRISRHADCYWKQTTNQVSFGSLILLYA